MKLLSSVLFISLSLSVWGNEKVNCHSHDGEWSVVLDLQDGIARNIEFLQHGQLVLSVTEVLIDTYRLPWNKMVYQIELSGIKYLSIERRVKKNIMLNKGSASFLLVNNPFGLERHAEFCEFRPF